MIGNIRHETKYGIGRQIMVFVKHKKIIIMEHICFWIWSERLFDRSGMELMILHKKKINGLVKNPLTKRKIKKICYDI